MKKEEIKITPQWSKSKDEIWNDMFEELEDTPKVIQMQPRRKPVWMYVAAAVAAIVILLPSIAFLYTKSETAGRGSHLAVVLPDGSKVELNAESKITYKPLWWKISRNVELQGEAYFEVEKGSKFDVRSGDYTVSVLGTSFNIFARADKYSVTCLTGKVSVADKATSVVLTPNMQAMIDNHQLKTAAIENTQEAISWKDGKFIFVSVPLVEVIQEIERQYDINVLPQSNLDYLYSGNFTKEQKPDDVLKIVGKPFGIDLKMK